MRGHIYFLFIDANHERMQALKAHEGRWSSILYFSDRRNPKYLTQINEFSSRWSHAPPPPPIEDGKGIRIILVRRGVSHLGRWADARRWCFMRPRMLLAAEDLGRQSWPRRLGGLLKRAAARVISPDPPVVIRIQKRAVRYPERKQWNQEQES